VHSSEDVEMPEACESRVRSVKQVQDDY
jgi:hypothetical protein